jgi:hypothetical protein
VSHRTNGKAVFTDTSTCAHVLVRHCHNMACCALQKESKHEASIRAAESLDYSQAPFMMDNGDSPTPTVVVMVAEQVITLMSATLALTLSVRRCLL